MQTIICRIEEKSRHCTKLVLSAPKSQTSPIKRITLERVADEDKFYITELRDTKAFHKNLPVEMLGPYLNDVFQSCHFRRANVFSEAGETAFLISKKGKLTEKNIRTSSPAVCKSTHNREKEYLIREGDNLPFLTELGIFTEDRKIVRSKYDKFRQINRFIEIVDHALGKENKDFIRVLDFGCGKSYLTFLIYHYFSVIRQKNVEIIGYDLKRDVVEDCNRLAKKCGYDRLSFIVADVTRDALFDGEIDMVISLHACDTATDYALHFALQHKVNYIFSVPCCQHEVNSSIKKGGSDLDLLLENGIFKERVSSLLTDAFRVRILESEGYHVDVLEFVDFSHSPKNLMLRAKRKTNGKRSDKSALYRLENTYGFTQTLLHLQEDKHD